MWIVRTAVFRPITTVMIFMGILIFGLLSYRQLSLDLLPDIKYPKLLIQTSLKNATADEILEFVTRPIEQSIGNVNSVTGVLSRSSEGLSIIVLDFYWGTDMDFAALAVRERLDEIRNLLPRRAERPQVFRLDPSANPIMYIATLGNELDQVTRLCRQVVRRRLEQIPGVAMVQITGGISKEVEIQIDPRNLLTYGMTLNQIATILAENNVIISGGTINKGSHRFSIRLDGSLKRLSDIKNTVLTSPLFQTSFLLGEIASVHLVQKDETSLTRLNGHQVVGLEVIKEVGLSTVAISRNVKKELKNIETDVPELTFTVISEEAAFIVDSIYGVISTLVLGGLLAFVALVFFLGNFRHPLNIGIAMPVSIIATFVLLRIANIDLNLLSLGGLALGVGMLVDNSIVVLENIFRLREEGESWVQAAIVGASEVAMPITASTLTTCAVFVPILYIDGIAGQLFRDQALTIIFSLISSLLVAIMLLPVLASRFKGKPQIISTTLYRRQTDIPQSAKRNRFFDLIIALFRRVIGRIRGWFINIKSALNGLISQIFVWSKEFQLAFYSKYLAMLLYTLQNGKQALILVLVIFGFASYLGINMSREFFPNSSEDKIEVSIVLSKSATLKTVSKVLEQFETQLLIDAKLELIYSTIGIHSKSRSTPDGSDLNEARILLVQKDSSKISKTELAAYVRRKLSELSQNYSFTYSIKNADSFYTEMLENSAPDLQINVTGSSYAILLPVAQQLNSKIRSLPGVVESKLSYQTGIPQFLLKINRKKLASLGISINQLETALKSRMFGVFATNINQEDLSIELIVRLNIDKNESWADLWNGNLVIEGKSIKLNELVETSKVLSAKEILREDQRSLIRMDVKIEQGSRNELIKQIQQNISEIRSHFNQELLNQVAIKIGGKHEDIELSLRGIIYALLLSIALVYMILAAQFESLIYPILILLAIPFGAIGAVLFLLVTGDSINIVSGLGFVILTGIVVNDAILKVEFINRGCQSGLSVRDSILLASSKRFRPIIITTFTTILGSLPLLFIGGPGEELRQSLAAVIIGGLISGTTLTLFILPVIYESIQWTNGNQTSFLDSDHEDE